MSDSPYRILLERLRDAADLALRSGSEGSLERAELSAAMLLIASRSRAAKLVYQHVKHSPEDFAHFQDSEDSLIVVELGHFSKTENDSDGSCI